MPAADRAIRFALTAAVVALASVSFLVSYRHCYALALHLGEDETTARLIPLTVDLLLIAAAMTGLFCSRYNLPQPRLARVALLMGISATVAVNVAHGLLSSVWAAMFGAWPAIALVTSSELLLWLVAASRSMEKRSVVVVEKTESPKRDELLSRCMTLIANEPRISGAELGRRLGVPYATALLLSKQAKGMLANV